MKTRATKRLVSLIVAHADGSLSSVAYGATEQQFAELIEQLGLSTGGPLYSRHIPAGDVAAWGPQVGRLGVVIDSEA